MSLAVKKKGHARTVTRFVEEANIGEEDQLDLAEFIVAAHYLGSEANDSQLMAVFSEIESSDASSTKNPKELIKQLLAKVDEDYGISTPLSSIEADTGDSKEDDGTGEVMQIMPMATLDASDKNWQDMQLGGFLTDAYKDQNEKIAKNLLETTALSIEQIADLTGCDKALVEKWDEEMDDDFDSDDDMEDEVSVGLAQQSNAKSAAKSLSPPAGKAGAGGAGGAGGVTIQSADFSKSLAMTRKDLTTLDEIVSGGADKVAEKKEEALELLTKLKLAVGMTPSGLKKMRSARKLLKTQILSTALTSDDKAKLAADIVKREEKKSVEGKYRVVIHPGALVKAGADLKTKEVAKLPIGTLVNIVETQDRRARMSSPVKGWCSITSGDGRTILQKEGTKSKLMDKAIHADRARQTKLLILKSITTLNDATVQRILEKSDWNLRRAIEAFYIAKYKTQEYIKTQEKSDDKGAKKGGAGATGGSAKKGFKLGDEKSASDKKKKAFWKSWKKFAANN